jgi:putative ABC transport system substrate-binding protein
MPVAGANRRAFIAALGGAAAWPLVARAQQGERMRRIGVLVNQLWAPMNGLREGLHELGYVEGQNIRLKYRFAEGHHERYAALADELSKLPVDVIVAWGTEATLAARKATTTIPIVMSAGDPVGAGLVASLARPGGNVTGLSSQMAEGEGKRLELIKDVLPRFYRVAVLSNPTNPYCVIAAREAQLAATALGLQFDLVNTSGVGDLDEAFAKIEALHPDAVLAVADGFLLSERKRIADQLIKQRLPSIFNYHEHVVAGGLMAYATNYYEVFRREALFIDKIFKGAKPSDLPVEQPTKFELVINLNTARALGLTIPQTLLARADEVIE